MTQSIFKTYICVLETLQTPHRDYKVHEAVLNI